MQEYLAPGVYVEELENKLKVSQMELMELRGYRVETGVMGGRSAGRLCGRLGAGFFDDGCGVAGAHSVSFLVISA